MTTPHRRRVGFAIAAVMVLSACSNAADGPISGESTGSTSLPTAPRSTDTAVEGSTTSPPSNTTSEPATGPSTGPSETSVVAGPSFTNPSVALDPCGFTPSGSTASITYVDEGRLLELDTDLGQAKCLAALDADPSGRVQWSPGGDQVLLGGEIVIDADGPRATGYFAENQGVRWSYPTGKALLAPAVKDGALLWRDSHDADNRIDVSFLAHTDIAVYHPAGKNIIASGTNADGVEGLFLASNRGENVRALATLDDPATQIVEIAAGLNGSSVYFIHDHGGVMHIHQSELPFLGLFDVYESAEPLAALTVPPVPGSRIAFRAGSCSGTVRTMVSDLGVAGAIDVSSDQANLRLPGADAMIGQSVEPVGWIDADRLAVAARPSGCAGPADIWLLDLSTADLSGRQLLADVEFVAVRSVVTAYGEVPDDINAQAPG